jgi:hypothetical protein
MSDESERRGARLLHKMRSWRVKWGGAATAAPNEDLETERLAILKMVAEGKICAEQAEMLLDALER